MNPETSSLTSLKRYQCTVQVRGYELDSYGHVNHSIYLNYLEHARWEMLNVEAITPETFQAWKCCPVVADIEISYLKPTYIGETLEILSQVTSQTYTSFQVEQTIFRDQIPVTKAKIRVVMVNNEGRPTAIPEAFKTKFPRS